VYDLPDGAAMPGYASSDGRLGPLKTVTAGLTYGFPAPGSRGEWSLRGEVIHPWGDRHPPGVGTVRRNLDPSPPLDIGTLTVGYSIDF
jgi:hypothetical protein